MNNERNGAGRSQNKEHKQFHHQSVKQVASVLFRTGNTQKEVLRSVTHYSQIIYSSADLASVHATIKCNCKNEVIMNKEMVARNF